MQTNLLLEFAKNMSQGEMFDIRKFYPENLEIIKVRKVL